ncbi:hypothetical protein V2L06_20400 [Pseudomonas alliivorans]|nr:hypothetical protein [Pseudomonas alliivorans]
MSNEYKLVPVEPTPEMLYAGRSAIGFLWIYKAMLEAAPQPPALGGEPELDCLADIPYANETPADWDPDYRKIWQELQVATRNKSQLRAHLAPLQAEIERLQQKLGREENEHCTTVNARDNAEKVADEMAKAIGEKFRVDVGEHSNMNCPWGMALSILNGEYVTDSDVERERDQLKARNVELESALKFYADREHYHFESGNWDTVSGEPLNILWCGDDPDFIEDGSVARNALSKPAGSEQV